MPVSERVAERQRRRADPAEAEAIFKSLVPDGKLRQSLSATLAESIEAANEQNPSAWELTLDLKRPLVRLNMGIVFVWSLQPDGVWVAIRPRSLDAETKRELKQAELRRDRFKVHTDLRFVLLPPDKLPGLWEIGRASCRERV